MKQRLAVLVILLLVMAVGTTAQAAQRSISTSPFIFADGLIAAEYEWRKSYNTTNVFHIGFESASGESSLVTGYGTHLYFSNRVLEGPYIGAAGIFLTSSNKESSDDDFDALEISFNGRAGIKFDLDPLVLDLALQFEIPMLTWSDSGSKLGVGRVRNKLGLGVGYAW